MNGSQKELNRFLRRQRTPESTAGLPLRDLRVLDLATVMAAPFAATLMGDFGAEIIKVENPETPDATRRWGVIENGLQPFWIVFSRNKFPVTLNLKTPEGKKILLNLAAKSDVLIENMRPGAMERLGLDVETLHKVNPGLIIGRVSGYGQDGPYASKPGFGTLAEGFSGFTALNSYPGGPPTNPPMALADFIAGIHLAFAVMTALHDQKGGQRRGRVIDIALYEPLFGLFGSEFLSYVLTGQLPEPKGSELSYVVPRNNYLTKDGKWVALSGAAQKPFERLMEVTGHPEMNEDPRFKTNEERIKDENRLVINQVISEWIGCQNFKDVLETCDRLGVTIGPVATMADIAEDPHYKERQSFIEIEDPLTKCKFRMPNVAFRLLGSPGRIRFPGLPMGAANEVVFQDLLGISPEEVAELKKAGAI